LNETIRPGDGGIAENMGMVNRINSVQAAWHYETAPLLVIIPASRQSHGSGADGAKNDRNRQGEFRFVEHCRISGLFA
jgi:hypothetical protein